jgi:hypothetical protein
LVHISRQSLTHGEESKKSKPFFLQQNFFRQDRISWMSVKNNGSQLQLYGRPPTGVAARGLQKMAEVAMYPARLGIVGSLRERAHVNILGLEFVACVAIDGGGCSARDQQAFHRPGSVGS